MTLKPRADRPIDPASLAVIHAVMEAASHLGVKPFLVGATARVILLEHVFGLPSGRATLDVDFAVAVENWEQFHAVKQHLIETASCVPTRRAEHRLTVRPPGIGHERVIDLIPFGGIETADHQIAWPPDLTILMNVAGFAEAFAAAIPIEVTDGLTIPVASLPGLVLLKTLAWMDRGRENPKDATDLLVLLRRYHEAGNQGRVYEDANLLEAQHYDIERVGAWLLGRDASAVALPDTRSRIHTLFARPELVDRLAVDMARGKPGFSDSLEHTHALLDRYRQGFTNRDLPFPRAMSNLR